MATSNYNQLNTITELISRSKAQSVLDIGVGFGKYGVLAREYLELWVIGKKYDDWKVRIDGVEAFEEYLTPLHDYIYDNIYKGEVPEILKALDFKYDLILLVDIIEHLEYEDGLRLLSECERLGKYILISTPKDIGEGKEHWESSHQTHRFQWEEKHFANYSDKTFVSNEGTLICLIGEGALAIGGKVKSKDWNNVKWKLGQKFPLLKKIYSLLK